jgi:hypothetical protein
MKDLFFAERGATHPGHAGASGKCRSELASATRCVAWLICADRRPHRAHLEIVSFRAESGVRPGEGDVEMGHAGAPVQHTRRRASRVRPFPAPGGAHAPVRPNGLRLLADRQPVQLADGSHRWAAAGGGGASRAQCRYCGGAGRACGPGLRMVSAASAPPARHRPAGMSDAVPNPAENRAGVKVGGAGEPGGSGVGRRPR